MNRAEISPNQVRALDTTLRDGGQTPGVNMRPEGRMEVALMLARMNVDIIEAGFPISNQENFESVSAIARAVNGPVIAALSRANLKDVDRCWEAIEPANGKGGARIHTFIATSPIHMVDKLRMTPEKVIAKIEESVSHARKYTDNVQFSAEDAMRTEPDFLIRAALTAVDAGATTVNIPDTVGGTNPWRYGQTIAEVKRSMGERSVVISTHCHDDRGLATINTLAGVIAGARQVEVSVNGIGERAGNAALEEIVANFLVNDTYLVAEDGTPLFTGVDASFIFALSELVERISGIAVPPNKPIVGSNAFAHESGIHADGVRKNRETYEIMNPRWFGERDTRIVIGAESGHSAIVGGANELGFDISDRVGFTERVKDHANKVRGEVTDTELEKLAASFVGEELMDRFRLAHVETRGTDNDSHSKVKIVIDGQEHYVEAIGRGPIEASVQAIRNITGMDIEIANFNGKSLMEGADAKAGVKLTVKNGMKITSYAEDDSVPLAAVKAYMAALNTIDRIEKRKAPKRSDTVVDVFVAAEAKST